MRKKFVFHRNFSKDKSLSFIAINEIKNLKGKSLNAMEGGHMLSAGDMGLLVTLHFLTEVEQVCIIRYSTYDSTDRVSTANARNITFDVLFEIQDVLRNARIPLSHYRVTDNGCGIHRNVIRAIGLT